METSITIAVIGLIGALVGGCISVLGNLFSKRQERNAQLHKIISEKRLEAHEELIMTVRYAAFGAGNFKDGEYTKYPMIMQTLEDYDRWLVEYIARGRRVLHLIDRSLADRLNLFQNYLHYLEQIALDPIRKYTSDETKDRLMIEVGIVVYDDFIIQCNDIIEQASAFYSTGIYRGEFVPSTIGASSDTDYNQLSKLQLFVLKDKIIKMVS